jgi:methyl-accepting chemotaxis protein
MSTPEAQLNQIAVQVGKLETLQEATAKSVGDLAGAVNRFVDRLDKSDDVAKEAARDAKSAHKRIDEIKTGQRWLIGITITLAGLFVSAAVLILKLAGQ